MRPNLRESGVGPLQGLDDGHAVQHGERCHLPGMIKRAAVRDVAVTVVANDGKVSVPKGVHHRSAGRAEQPFTVAVRSQMQASPPSLVAMRDSSRTRAIGAYLARRSAFTWSSGTVSSGSMWSTT